MGMLAVIFISKKPKCSFGTPTSVPGLTAEAGVHVCGDREPSASRQFKVLQVLEVDLGLVTPK